MEPLDDFFTANPGASYEDFLRMNEMMYQDIMASTLPSVDMDMFVPDAQTMEIDPMAAMNPAGIAPVIDMFGNPHFVDPMDVDIMSGLPSSEFHCQPISAQPDSSDSGSSCESYDQMRLDESNEIEAMRDAAVEHYRDAKAAGDIEEMLKWEAEANKQQGRLYDFWGTPTYGVPPKAPGIN